MLEGGVRFFSLISKAKGLNNPFGMDAKRKTTPLSTMLFKVEDENVSSTMEKDRPFPTTKSEDLILVDKEEMTVVATRDEATGKVEILDGMVAKSTISKTLRKEGKTLE